MQMSKKGKSGNFWEWVKTPVGIFGKIIANRSNFEGELPLEFVGIFGNFKEILRIVHGCVVIWDFSLRVHFDISHE